MRTGVKEVQYNSSRCEEVKSLVDKGVPTIGPIPRKLFGFLGHRFRAEYKVSNQISMKPSQFEYLLNDLPLAAKLVNTFKQTKYNLSYVEGSGKKTVKGNRGNRMYGEATLLAGSTDEKTLTYFGVGIVKIFKWRLRGPILLYYNYSTDKGNTIKYNMTIKAAAMNKLVNMIMNMAVFKAIVKTHIEELFKEIAETTEEINKISFDKLLEKSKWSEEEQQKLKELRAL
jgi:hypothetical protein